MRVRITKQPQFSYGLDPESLRLGRVYNLDSALASTLLADGCAELYELPTADERKFQYEPHRAEMWQAKDRSRAPRWGSPKVSPDPTEA